MSGTSLVVTYTQSLVLGTSNPTAVQVVLFIDSVEMNVIFTGSVTLGSKVAVYSNVDYATLYAGQTKNISLRILSIAVLGFGLSSQIGNISSPYSYTFPSTNVPCFLADAPVLTPSGYKPIASLREGDLVTTADGRDVAIERVSVTRVLAPSAAVNPYVIKKGQFGATENLSISPRHRIAVPGKGMVEARELGLSQWTMRGAFDYYNLELPSWKSDNMVVAGVEVESLAPVHRTVVTAEQLKAMLAGKTLDAAFVAKLRRVIRPVAGGFEVPLLKKSAAK